MEGYDEYEDEIEDQKDQQEDYERQVEERKRMGGDEVYDYPKPKESESLYNLFHKVLNIEDSSRVGNLDKTELGLLPISVRESQRIALLAIQLGHPLFADYFRLHGEIVLRTSASKKGWFAELFVSQKKSSVSSKSIQPDQQTTDMGGKKRWGMFGRKR